jgi:hypothetical protein
MNWLITPKRRSAAMGKKCKDQTRIAELERLLGQLNAENELLKQAFAMMEGKVRE